MNDYKSRPRWIRVGRWLQHMPLAFLVACLMLLGWVLTGCRIRHPHMVKQPRIKWGRLQEARLLWNTAFSIAHVRMGNCVSLADFIAELKLRPKK